MGVNKKLDRWQQTAENFLFDHGTACRVYKAKFADHLRELGLYDQVDASVWKKKWIVDIRAVGDGRSVLKYLAPYVHRVAISDNRIVSVDEKTVTFRYTPLEVASEQDTLGLWSPVRRRLRTARVAVSAAEDPLLRLDESQQRNLS
ncbi:putative transposase [Rubripirellula obstinata]|uniref:Putative transposase n=1 Tax=Rubripirellula obstinata TaxID=406547 RepID=A0A5B1CPX3_9BACT|nr:putative transposase [Rubripirellula obstinata]